MFLCDVIIRGCRLDVTAWISNYSSYSRVDIITHPCQDVKGCANFCYQNRDIWDVITCACFTSTNCEMYYLFITQSQIHYVKETSLSGEISEPLCVWVCACVCVVCGGGGGGGVGWGCYPCTSVANKRYFSPEVPFLAKKITFGGKMLAGFRNVLLSRQYLGYNWLKS